MDTPFVNPILSRPGPWLVLTASGQYALCDSGHAALRAAYERSGQAPSWHDAPTTLVRVGTADRLGAEQILAECRNLGWPLPASEVSPDS